MVNKREDDGKDYPASAFLYVPDPSKPSTWKMRYKEYVNGDLKVTLKRLSMKAQDVSPHGFRGNKVDLPPEVMKSMKRKIRSLYRSLGVEDDKIPPHLKEGSLDTEPEEGALLFEGQIKDIFEGPAITTELVEFAEKEGHLRNVAMLGPISRNGRRYRQEVVQDAIRRRVYEGLPCFFDHDLKDARRVRDLVGEWNNTRYDPQTRHARGDLRILPEHQKTVFDLARTVPRQVAPSHVIEAKTRKVKEGDQTIEDVEYIHKGISVDLVIGAATVGSLTEHEETHDMTEKKLAEMTIEDIRTARPDLIEILLAEKKDESGDVKKVLDEIKGLREENKALKEQREKEAKLAASREVLAKALKDSVLTEEAQASIKSTCKDLILDEAQAKALVAEHVAFVEKATGQKLTKSTVDLPNPPQPAGKDKGPTTLTECFIAKTGLLKKEEPKK